MDDHNRTRLLILQMLQSGALEELVGCRDGRCAWVELRMERVYQIEMKARTIVMRERDVERIRQKTGRRWKNLGPNVAERGSVILDRASGKVLQAPALGVLRSPPRPRTTRLPVRRMARQLVA